MPQNTPELAWWVMTGAIAGLLSLITLMVGALTYFAKSAFDRIIALLDSLQSKEAETERRLYEQIARCEERHRQET
jgi:hypothetical protein